MMTVSPFFGLVVRGWRSKCAARVHKVGTVCIFVGRSGSFADEFAPRHMSRLSWWCPQMWSNVYEMHIPTKQTNIHSAHALASCVSEPASAASTLARQ